MTSNGYQQTFNYSRCPIQLDSSPKLSSKEIKSRPLSLEMFNCAASDLDTKGIINLKKYNSYLVKKLSKPS